jgi:hypothetical protein
VGCRRRVNVGQEKANGGEKWKRVKVKGFRLTQPFGERQEKKKPEELYREVEGGLMLGRGTRRNEQE